MALLAWRLSKLAEEGRMTHEHASMAKAWNSLRGREVCALGRELLVKRESTLNADGWPVIGEPVDVKAGSRVTVTTKCEGGAAAMTASVLPTAAPELAAMSRPGDQLFVGRYLVNGAETSSLYLEVAAVDAATGAVECVALNDATLGFRDAVNEGDAVALADPAEDLEPVHLRHHDVGEQQVKRLT